MSAAHPVSSSADPKSATAQPSHPLPDVTAPHDTAPPVPVAGAADGAAPAEKKAAKPQQQQQQQQGQKKEKKDKKAGAGASAGPLELSPPPEYFQERIKIFDEYMEKYKKHVAGE